MKPHHTLSKSIGFSAVVALLLFSSPITSRASDSKPPPSIVRLTPPPPVIEDKDRHAELAERRARLAQSLGTKAMLILFSAEPRVYTGDVDYEYRQENNLYYLTNLNQKGATLVMIPSNTQTPEILFLPQRRPRAYQGLTRYGMQASLNHSCALFERDNLIVRYQERY